MLYYVRLIRAFIRTSIQQDVAFRTDFFINLLNTILNLATGVAGLAILFSQVETIRGWTFSQTLALLGVYLLINALRGVFIGPSMNAIGGLGGDIWTGRFDFVMLKPVKTQFLVSFRNWRLWALVDVALSLIVLGTALIRLGEAFSLVRLGFFLIAMVISVTIVYAILLLLASGSFWYQGVPLIWIFNNLIQMGRYPVELYPGQLKFILTWIVPIGFITTVPAKAVTGQVSPVVLLSGIALSIGLLVIASLSFEASLRRYSSASG